MATNEGTALALISERGAEAAEHVRRSGNLPGARWTDEAIQTIARTIAPKASASELAMFLAICQRYDLDPLVRECWLAKDERDNPIVITGRDSMTTIANRQPDFGGLTVMLVYEADSYEVHRQQDGRIEVRHVRRGFPAGDPIGGWALLERTGKLPAFVERRWEDYRYLHGKANWKKDARGMFETRLYTAVMRRAYTLAGLYTTAEWDGAVLDAESGTESLAERTRQRMAGLRERMAGSAPVLEAVEVEDHEHFLQEIPNLNLSALEVETEAAPESVEQSDPLAGVPAKNYQGAYFAMLHEAQPEWGDVERKLWQEQNGLGSSTKKWKKDDYIRAMRLIEAGVLGIEYPEPEAGDGQMPY
jgi:hypothetical protein